MQLQPLYPPVDAADANHSSLVVTTIPEFPLGPSGTRATCASDGYVPCSPAPRYVPAGVEDDDLGLSDVSYSRTSRSGPSNYSLPSKLVLSTSFADPPTDETLNGSRDLTRYDDCSDPPNVSDGFLYSRRTYAHPNPVLIMIQRADFDELGLQDLGVIPLACDEPLKLFTLTGGHTPMTGLKDVDEQSFKYYAQRPFPVYVLSDRLSYRYPLPFIKGIQRSLPTSWSSVYPGPIPPVIIRSRDLVGPYSLKQRADGFAFVVPTEDSIWGTIRQRGIDSNFRPIDPSLTIETEMCAKGDAFYYPQHIVASKFAVNIFLELPDSCEYLGAYVLQVMNGLTISPSMWAHVNPEVQQSVYDRVFAGYSHPSVACPRLPYVRFCFYKWDRHVVALVDETILKIYMHTVNQGIARRNADGSGGSSKCADSGSDT